MNWLQLLHKLRAEHKAHTIQYINSISGRTDIAVMIITIIMMMIGRRKKEEEEEEEEKKKKKKKKKKKDECISRAPFHVPCFHAPLR